MADLGGNLERLDLARRALADATTLEDIARLDDVSERLRLVAVQDGLGLDAANLAVELRLRTQRKGGEFLIDLPRAPGARSDLPTSGGDLQRLYKPTYERAGITEYQNKTWRIIAQIPPETFEAFIAETMAAREEMTTAGLLRFADDAPPPARALGMSGNNEWYTPLEFVEAARAVMGGIDLDPASSATANAAINAGTIFTADTDGLRHEWWGRVWLNPPYGREAGETESNQARWSARLIEEHRAGRVEQAVLLVNAVPGNRWWSPLWDFPVCFASSRIRFLSPTGESGSPTHSNALVYLGGNVAAFVRAFEPFGPVVRRIEVDDAGVV